MLLSYLNRVLVWYSSEHIEDFTAFENGYTCDAFMYCKRLDSQDFNFINFLTIGGIDIISYHFEYKRNLHCDLILAIK